MGTPTFGPDLTKNRPQNAHILPCMLRFFGQFFVKSEPKLDVLRMQIHVVNGYH